MKRVLLTFLTTCLFPIFIFSQSFTVQFDNVEIIGSSNPIYTYEADLNNNGADTLYVRMTIFPQEMPIEWEITMCTINGCFLPGVTVDSFPVAPGQSEKVWVEFFTNNVPGTGSVFVLFENQNDVDDFVTITLNIDTTLVGIQNGHNFDFMITQNYPNPFRQMTTIDYDLKTENGILFIHDLRGRIIHYYNIAQKGSLEFGSEWNAGLYIITFQQEGNTYAVCKMIKND